jgi:hypothetical protein
MMVLITIIEKSMMLTKNQPWRVSFHLVFPNEYQMTAMMKNGNRNEAFQNIVTDKRNAKEKIHLARGSILSMMLFRYRYRQLISINSF